MIANGNYMQKEIAYRENGDGEYSPIADNIDKLIIDLFNYAAENPEAEGEWEDYHKGTYQDNYYLEREGVDYCVQYDIITQTATLYELKER